MRQRTLPHGETVLQGRNCRLRLDKYLKVSRLIKRRTVANEACTAGRVLLNGKEAKPAAEVKPGDELEIRLGARALRVRVEDINEHAQKADAALLYTMLPEKP